MNFGLFHLNKIHAIVFFMTLLLVILSINNAYALTDANGTMDVIVEIYKNKSRAWEATLVKYAKNLFWLLAGIEFCWMSMQMALRGADFTEWMAQLVNQILFIGFFYALLLNSSDWARAIIQSFISAADAANASTGSLDGITPSNIFDMGLSLVVKLMKSLSIWDPGYAGALIFAAFFVMICFSFITAFMVLTLVEAYVVISAGVLMSGFGGSRWTKEYAIKMLTYAVSVGAKLFILQLLMGLSESMINGWVNNFETKFTDIYVVEGASFVLAILTWGVPSMMQGLINGTSLRSGIDLAKPISMVAGVATGVVSGVVGGGMAVSAATKLASTQGASSESSGGSVGSTFGRTMKNLGSAAVSDVGRRLSGRANHGTMGARMAETMNQKNTELKTELRKPTLYEKEQKSSGNSEKNVIR